MRLTKKKIVIGMICFLFQITPANANQSERITNLEKRITALEKEIARIQQQEARASKYLKCVQSVDGNTLTIPFKILNCIRR